MMVLASVYISVSSSLPVTAGIKYVEVWLLFNLAYPVLVILVNIVLKVTKHYSNRFIKTALSLSIFFTSAYFLAVFCTVVEKQKVAPGVYLQFTSATTFICTYFGLKMHYLKKLIFFFKTT